MSVALSLLLILILLVGNEILCRKKSIEPETGRKIIHILVGTFIAFWPLYMSWKTIQILSALLFIGVAVSYQFGIFGSIHNVKRRTSGELWYPVGIGLSAAATVQPWIFTVAILHLSLADGFAAIIGKRYGIMHYRIGEHTRSMIGSLAFLIISYALCMVAFVALRSELPGASLAVFAVTPFLATSVESISRHGLDNLLVPLAVIISLGIPTGTLTFGIGG
jgi:phytol kinase